MKKLALEDISQKLVQIIETQDSEKVRYWAKILDRQRDPLVTAEVFIRIRRHLSQKDQALDRWFQDIYFENYNPDVKDLWLDFVELCSLSVS
ncbi:MAG TPA: hypothetical protein V6C78_12015 [Crinalium sp.]|jgi:hypothetical protein